MISTFHLLSEQEKKLFIAKIIHEMNYNQASFKLMQLLVSYWDENPINHVEFFPNQFITKAKHLKNGTANN
jgi:hypothetical protein